MRFNLIFTLLITAWLSAGLYSSGSGLLAQSSPPPAIIDYDNTALADSLWPGTDSAFCKGGSYTIHGQYFKRVQGGETWDTTYVFLGSYPGGTKVIVTGIATGGGGTNDRINITIPDIFVADTCMPLLVIKRTFNPVFTYIDTAQICLTGDWASVTYADSAFCVGDVNPIPAITLSDSASGSFCCASGASGFYVLPTGEIPLHQGAVGEDNSFWFFTDHPICGDSLHLFIDLRNPPPSLATYNGSQTPVFCQNEQVNPISDTANLFPKGGHFLAQNGQLVLANDSTGEINLQANQPGTYTLLYMPAELCSDTVTISVTITPIDDPAFRYPPFNSFCINDPDPWPLILGTGGGVFKAASPVTVVDPDGRLQLQASGPGQHIIRYLTAGPCPDSLEVTVWILSSASASFSYPASVFCKSDSNPRPVIQGTPGGVFTADSGLVIHSDSGWIDLVSSSADTFNVTYALSGNCNVSFSQTVIILENDSSTSIEYGLGRFCPDALNPRPILLGDSLGRFIAGAGLIFANTDSGIVDLSLTPPGGPYTVLFDVANACAADPVDSVWVLDFDNAFFSYLNSSYCQASALLSPDTVTLPQGFFSEPTGNVLFVEPDSGVIDLEGSIPGGPYSISHITAGNCPATFTSSLTILPRPTGVSLSTHPGSSVCQGTQVTFRALGAGASVYDFRQNGVAVSSLLDLYQTDSLSNGASISVILSTNLGCSDTASLTVEIKPIPDVQWLDWPDVVTGDESLEIRLGASVDSTYYHWHATVNGPLSINDPFDTTRAIDPGQPISIQPQAELQSDFEPAKLTLIVTPNARGCKGETDSLTIDFMPGPGAVFIPGVFTPDGNGKNDTWLVKWREGENPENYTIHLMNRSGGEVFTMNPIHENWDGDRLPDGVYWWSLNGPEGEFRQRGGLTIRRK